MRILAGTITRTQPRILAAHLASMQAQRLPRDCTLDLVYIDDNDDEESSALVRRAARTLPASSAGGGYAVDELTHRWSIGAFARVGAEKNRLLAEALTGGYDALWLVDSDLVVAPDTLALLVAADKPIVSGVFWTCWQPGDPPQPQVWQTHPYGFAGNGWKEHEFLRALDERKLVRVKGLGACTLIRADAIHLGVSFSPVDGLPHDGMWQGEDRHFCVRAERLHLPLFADAFTDIFHCYRPSDVSFLDDMAAKVASAPKAFASEGDWVAFTIESLSETQLIGHTEHVRGRLGNLRVLPEIEAALRELAVGDARLVHANFPEWWEFAPYRNSAHTLRVRLLAARAGDRIISNHADREFAPADLTALHATRRK